MEGLRLQFYKGRAHFIKPETCGGLIFRYFIFMIAFSQRNMLPEHGSSLPGPLAGWISLPSLDVITMQPNSVLCLLGSLSHS